MSLFFVPESSLLLTGKLVSFCCIEWIELNTGFDLIFLGGWIKQRYVAIEILCVTYFTFTYFCLEVFLFLLWLKMILKLVGIFFFEL